jgi:hypothetical protein
MRRNAARLAASALAAALTFTTASTSMGQSRAPQPPHAWLFGTWSGGLFPAPSGLSAEACLSQPVVIFTRDTVLRATLTEQTFVQRLVATARAMPGGFEFSFRPNDSNSAANGLFGITNQPAAVGFGCESPDALKVQRIGENEITFPGCRDFPNPLVRCTGR